MFSHMKSGEFISYSDSWLIEFNMSPSKVRELHSLYVYVNIFCVVVSSEVFLLRILLTMNNFQSDLFDP